MVRNLVESVPITPTPTPIKKRKRVAKSSSDTLVPIQGQAPAPPVVVEEAIEEQPTPVVKKAKKKRKKTVKKEEEEVVDEEGESSIPVKKTKPKTKRIPKPKLPAGPIVRPTEIPFYCLPCKGGKILPLDKVKVKIAVNGRHQVYSSCPDCTKGLFKFIKKEVAELL